MQAFKNVVLAQHDFSFAYLVICYSLHNNNNNNNNDNNNIIIINNNNYSFTFSFFSRYLVLIPSLS